MAVTQTLTLKEVADSVDATKNQSQVRIQWTSTQTGDSWNGYTRTAKYYVSINGGAEAEYSESYVLLPNATMMIVDVVIPVDHRADGSATVSVRTWMDTKISAGVVELTKTLTLTTIQRASTITKANDQSLGAACFVQWTPLARTFTYKLQFTIGTKFWLTDVIKPNTTTAYTYTGYHLPYEIAKELPNSPTGIMKVTLATFSDQAGTVQVGDVHSTYITITVPNNASTQPKVSMSLSPENSKVLAQSRDKYKALYIQGLSKVKATLTCSAQYDASEVESNITVNGKVYPNPYESDILSREGTVTVKATAKDSRGYYGTYYQDIEVIPYAKPYIRAESGESSVIAARCDSSANFTDSGTYLKIKAKAVCSPCVSNGVQMNYGYIKFRYRKEGGAYTDWQTILDCKTDKSDEVITPPLLNGALAKEFNYQVQIIASDDFYESTPITIAIPSENVYMDRPAGGKSMGLGGHSSGDGKLDIYWSTIARGGLSLLDSEGGEIPLGSTMPIPRGQVPEGWNPDNLANGAYVVTNSKPLKNSEGTIIMYNGILIQLNGTVDGTVKFQLALTSDETRNPFYRAYWYGNWGNWRSMKL